MNDIKKLIEAIGAFLFLLLAIFAFVLFYVAVWKVVYKLVMRTTEGNKLVAFLSALLACVLVFLACGAVFMNMPNSHEYGFFATALLGSFIAGILSVCILILVVMSSFLAAFILAILRAMLQWVMVASGLSIRSIGVDEFVNDYVGWVKNRLEGIRHKLVG